MQDPADLPQSPNRPASTVLPGFLDALYGVWFQPEATFQALRQAPQLGQAALVVILAKLLESVRTSGGTLNPEGLVWAAVSGLLGWVVLSALLDGLAYVFGRGVDLTMLLSLTGFASLPWLLLGPALAWGGSVGRLLSLLVLVWFVIWQLWAAAVAFELPRQRLVLLVPLTLVGGLVSLAWLTNAIGFMIGLPEG